MEKFPQDVRTAEEKTGGDPNIINSEEFRPEQRPNIAEIFGDHSARSRRSDPGAGPSGSGGRGGRHVLPSISRSMVIDLFFGSYENR